MVLAWRAPSASEDAGCIGLAWWREALPQLRLVLAISLDGRLAPAAGGAAQIGGPGDLRVLEESLAWADGCLIGAETLRRHGTTCLIHAGDLLEQLLKAGIDAILDDRDERAGSMFADWELIGVPHRVVVGERGLKEGKLEYKGRRDAEATMVDVGEMPAFLKRELLG